MNKVGARIVAIVTVIAMVLVAVVGVQWKSLTKVFAGGSPKVIKSTEVTEVVEVTKDVTSESQTAVSTTKETAGSASSTPAGVTTTNPAPAVINPATTVAAETTAISPTTATATTMADTNTPITVVVQMPNETVPQTQTEKQTETTLTEEEVLTKKALAATWIHYYDMDIQSNGLAEDDFNFGPNPITDGQVREAAYYDAELRERLKWDPALAAAATAWVDANVGTRYLGVFYEACKHDWATAINAAKLKFAADQMSYYKNLDALFAYLNAATSVEVRPCQGVTDQMYMNPYTPDGIPDVIVMETTDQTGYQLVYKFLIKGNTFEVAFRINCGFQPTNVAELMKITPQAEPERTPSPKPTPTPTPTPQKETNTPTPTPHTEKNSQTETNTPTPTPRIETETDPPTPTPQIETETDPPTPTPQTETDPPTPTPQTETDPPTPTPQTETDPPTPTPQTETDPPTPTPQTETDPPTPPEPTPQKDPSQQHADNAEENDDPSPSESTNNGVGATESTMEQPENTSHYDSYDDYVETVSNLEQVNEEQAVGGDSNEPSYTPDVSADEPVQVDNNGDSGNADSDPIDVPTPVEEPAVAANTDEPITTEPGVAWDGPPDA